MFVGRATLNIKNYLMQLPYQNVNQICLIQLIIQISSKKWPNGSRGPKRQNIKIFQEDKILKYLHQVRGVSKWNDIAVVMKQEFSILGRNGKQCRQRYHNHLDSKINKGQWSQEQDKILIELHNVQGNRWAEISKNLQGRTDNCVKNRYYLKMRKGIKCLNQFISEFFKKKFKLLKPNIIYKILEISDQISRNHLVHKKDVALEAFDLKNQILVFCNAQHPDQPKQIEKIQHLISRINSFNKKNRRKNKKRHFDEESQHQDDERSSNDFLENRQMNKNPKQCYIDVPIRTGSLDTFHSVNPDKQECFQSEILIQQECNIFDNEKSNQEPELKDIKMISLMSMLEKDADENKSLRTSQNSNSEFQIDMGKEFLNDAQEYLQQFLRNDIFGFQQF